MRAVLLVGRCEKGRRSGWRGRQTERPLSDTWYGKASVISNILPRVCWRNCQSAAVQYSLDGSRPPSARPCRALLLEALPPQMGIQIQGVLILALSAPARGLDRDQLGGARAAIQPQSASDGLLVSDSKHRVPSTSERKHSPHWKKGKWEELTEAGKEEWHIRHALIALMPFPVNAEVDVLDSPNSSSPAAAAAFTTDALPSRTSDTMASQLAAAASPQKRFGSPVLLAAMDSATLVEAYCPWWAPALGFIGAALALVLGNAGAAYGTWKSALGLATIALMPKHKVSASCRCVASGVVPHPFLTRCKAT